MEKRPCTLRTDFPRAWSNQPSLIGLYMSPINSLVAPDGILVVFSRGGALPQPGVKILMIAVYGRVSLVKNFSGCFYTHAMGEWECAFFWTQPHASLLMGLPPRHTAELSWLETHLL